MLAYKKSNDGFNYYLVAIDIFSRKAYGAKMKNKDSVSAREAMQTIITKENQPRSILIDNDAEFLSNDGSVGETFSQFLEKKGYCITNQRAERSQRNGSYRQFREAPKINPECDGA